MTTRIDFSEVFPTEESMDQGDQVIRLVAESVARTEPIRQRVLELEAENQVLYKEYCEARSKFQFFRMRRISKKMDINRDLRETLYAKWRNNL